MLSNKIPPLTFLVTLGTILLCTLPVSATPSSSLKIEQIAWGTAVNNQISVGPGDTNIPLTMNVRNRSNYTLNGIYATLDLNNCIGGIYLFTNTSGGFETDAVGQALQVGNVLYQTGEVLPGTAFSLTFNLNIDPDTKPGSYSYPMRIEYLVNQSGVISLGDPQILNVVITLANRAPIIDSYTPMNLNPAVYIGDFLNFSVVCHDPDCDNVTYRWVLDDMTIANSSGYLYDPADGVVGTHTIEVRVSDGNLFTSQTWTVSVDKIRTTTISVLSNYVTGGLDNIVNVTITNNLWKGTVEIQMNLPAQVPLVVYDNSSWTFRNVDPNSAISIEPKIYISPSSIGTTFPITLAISYNDEYGRTYTDTRNIGMIVKGLINFVVYDIYVSPKPSYPGATVTITTTLLNRGNYPATNINASIQPSPILTLTSMSTSYVDQIDKNSPEPISLKTYVNSNTANGTYPVVFTISYMDDQLMEHTMTVSTNLAVTPKTGNNTNQGQDNSIQSLLMNGGWSIIILIGVTLVLVVLYFRHMMKRVS